MVYEVSTIETLRAAVDLLRGVPGLIQYYGTSEDAQRGLVLIVAGTDTTHYAWIFHPDDFEEIARAVAPLRLVHLRDAPPKPPARSPFHWPG